MSQETASSAPSTAAAAPEPAYRCPDRARPRGGVDLEGGDAPRALIAARLDVDPAALQDLVVLETPAIPDLVALAAAVVVDDARPSAALVTIHACGERLCAGEVRRYPGAASIEVIAILDLVGRGRTIVADAAARAGDLAAARGPCPRWPAAVVALRFAVDDGAESLHELVALRSPHLASLARAYSRVGAEGGLVLESLQIAATTGGGPGDLTVIRRRLRGDAGPCEPPRERRLHVFIDDRYTHAPPARGGACP